MFPRHWLATAAAGAVAALAGSLLTPTAAQARLVETVRPATASTQDERLVGCPATSTLEAIDPDAVWRLVRQSNGITECLARSPYSREPLFVLLVADLEAGARARLVSNRVTSVSESEPAGQFNYFRRRTLSNYVADDSDWLSWADSHPSPDDPAPEPVYAGVAAGDFIDRKKTDFVRLSLHEKREGTVRTIGARCWEDQGPRGILALTTPPSGRQRATIGRVMSGGGPDTAPCYPDLERYYDVTSGRWFERNDYVRTMARRTFVGVSNGAMWDDDEAGHGRIYVLTGNKPVTHTDAYKLISAAGAEVTLEMVSPQGLNAYRSPHYSMSPPEGGPLALVGVPEALVFYPAPPEQ